MATTKDHLRDKEQSVFEFKLPDLGEGVHEGEILHWYVKQGDEITEDDPLVEVETDKAAVTIPSPKSGKVVSTTGGVGETISVGTVLVVIDEGANGQVSQQREAAGADGEAEEKRSEAAQPAQPAPSPAAKPQPPRAEEAEAQPAEERPTGGVRGRERGTKGLTPVTRPSGDGAAGDTGGFERRLELVKSGAAPQERARAGGPVPAAPATRRLARELGVDLRSVSASGPGGRVTAEDVRAHAEGGSRGGGGGRPAAAAAAEEAQPLPEVDYDTEGGAAIPFFEVERLPDFTQWGAVETEPLRSIRRKVAHKMVASMTIVPHVAHMDEADVTDLDAFRKRQNAKRDDVKLTLLAFVIKAAVAQLRRAPKVNASIDPHRQQIVYKQYYNIGFAADTPKGLVVPVIHNADQMSVIEIGSRLIELAGKAREGSIDVAEMRGGTFTITNLGSLGGTGVIPTINYPEVAILGLGRAEDKPVVRDGEIVIRKILPMTIAYDHRLVDGADAARFLGAIVERLEDPERLLLES